MFNNNYTVVSEVIDGQRLRS